jgi:hypothetical protein
MKALCFSLRIFCGMFIEGLFFLKTSLTETESTARLGIEGGSEWHVKIFNYRQHHFPR